MREREREREGFFHFPTWIILFVLRERYHHFTIICQSLLHLRLVVHFVRWKIKNRRERKEKRREERKMREAENVDERSRDRMIYQVIIRFFRFNLDLKLALYWGPDVHSSLYLINKSGSKRSMEFIRLVVKSLARDARGPPVLALVFQLTASNRRNVLRVLSSHLQPVKMERDVEQFACISCSSRLAETFSRTIARIPLEIQKVERFVEK